MQKSAHDNHAPRFSLPKYFLIHFFVASCTCPEIAFLLAVSWLYILARGALRTLPLFSQSFRSITHPHLHICDAHRKTYLKLPKELHSAGWPKHH